MVGPFPRHTRRIAALALLFAVVAGLGVATLLPARTAYQSAHLRLEQYRAALAGYEQLADRSRELRPLVDSLRQGGSFEGLLLPVGSDSSSAAAIQTRVQSIVAGAGAELTSVEALPSLGIEGYQRIGLRVQFVTDVNALRTILHALEYGRPIMIFDNVFVHAQTSRAVGVVNPLAVRMDVFSFRTRDS
ncbi:MAG: hypothetical protein EXQ86_03750 [Rhodospirillales bacterium]|nr:hypothetical protein [Rhodospirillales bacterium]